MHSARMEGVHLRGARVARGGIRWSDRPDDFRTEVLGLVNTQMVKNAVIVPGGSKGGFVPRHLPADPEARADQAAAAAGGAAGGPANAGADEASDDDGVIDAEEVN